MYLKLLIEHCIALLASVVHILQIYQVHTVWSSQNELNHRFLVL